MLELDFTPLHQIDRRHGLTPAQIKSEAKKLPRFLKEIEKKDQGFYTTLDDQKILRDIEAYAKKVTGKYQFIVVLGIGGSALGAACVWDALRHPYQAYLKGKPQLFVVDNIDPEYLERLNDVIDHKKTLFVVVTKSGGTPETLASYLYFRQCLERKKLKPTAHFCFITDPKKGFLRFIGDREGIPSFSVPPNVGGRFSVLTAVGLVPAALMGFDIRALIRGAKRMRSQFLSRHFETNLAFQLAVIQYLMHEKEKATHVLIPYSARLARFADWYCQLLAESTGKEKKRLGRTVHVGITPIRALGVTDQHSQFQLYNQGPNDKLILFVHIKKKASAIRVPGLYAQEESIQYFHGVSFQSMMDAEMQASQKALTEYHRPSLTIAIDRVDEEHVGMLFMLFQGATAFLGEFLEINAFDQPGVELGKKLTKQILNKQ